MKPIHLGGLLLLGAIWGASFLFIREAAHDFGPLALMFMRVLLAGLVLLAYAAILKNTPDWRSKWREFLIVGALNSAIPFTLIAFSELTITASLAAILNSTTPLFTALVAAFTGGEALTGRKMIGVVLGIVGVSVLVGGSPLQLDNAFLIAVGASLLAALFYGLGTVYASRNISNKMTGLHASIGQLLGATVVLALPAASSIPATAPSANSIYFLIALALLSTSFAYIIYFFLLRNIGPTRTSSVTFLVPVFGSIWGIIFLREPYSIWMFVGMAIIFTSIGLVMGIGVPKAKTA